MVMKDTLGGYDRFTLCNDVMKVSVISIGACVTELCYKGRSTVLNYPEAEPYLVNPCFLSVIAGRYANRIGGAKFTINGTEYKLTANEGANQLHGGFNTMGTAVWTGEADENSITMRYSSPTGDNGYPGNLTAEVKYSLLPNGLRIDFMGTSDADTVYGPTSHIYFTLGNATDVRSYRLQLNSPGWLETDTGLIPTGKVMPNDYAELKPIAKALDTCYLCSTAEACTVQGDKLSMQVKTDYPALQVYTGEHLQEPFPKFSGIAVEAEYCPDSPNQPSFEFSVLKAGEQFHKYVEYTFAEV